MELSLIGSLCMHWCVRFVRLLREELHILRNCSSPELVGRVHEYAVSCKKLYFSNLFCLLEMSPCREFGDFVSGKLCLTFRNGNILEHVAV